MDHNHPLHGGCSCGRNRYTIRIPQDATERPQVFFDSGHGHRRFQATPLSAWLRVPLSWYESTTYAFMDDESHASIRRTYTSPSERSSKRHFCGFCGTPLAYWSEETPVEASYISLTLGSLAGKDLRDLEDLGVLPREAVEDAVGEREVIEESAAGRGGRGVLSERERGESGLGSGVGEEGLPWFETMVKGSKLGNVQRSWGKRRSQNGRFKVEWEIVEWTEEEESAGEGTKSPAKRKLGDVDGNGDQGDVMEH
ncbi:hypothetical protein ONS95_009589 [Cadophora gregata]|uniref:uncharacterized protein n=1 Tax=Cadophora gregata TaxID=51156 RepID=UPI0026DB2298|nr:uncharacterized protein ONS95_009589 [Cadophora gregata]KAK0124642.1 hypothetical protein ONS95_009589 [Cadophora gregata]KAK0129500.1 hypothetical protein ONS96_000066 [Cadophora gregata f. sp. sojae]